MKPSSEPPARPWTGTRIPASRFGPRPRRTWRSSARDSPSIRKRRSSGSSPGSSCVQENELDQRADTCSAHAPCRVVCGERAGSVRRGCARSCPSRISAGPRGRSAERAERRAGGAARRARRRARCLTVGGRGCAPRSTHHSRNPQGCCAPGTSNVVQPRLAGGSVTPPLCGWPCGKPRPPRVRAEGRWRELAVIRRVVFPPLSSNAKKGPWTAHRTACRRCRGRRSSVEGASLTPEIT